MWSPTPKFDGGPWRFCVLPVNAYQNIDDFQDFEITLEPFEIHCFNGHNRVLQVGKPWGRSNNFQDSMLRG